MSRSVSVPHSAVAVAYGEYDGDDQWDFDMLVEDFQQYCQYLWPSLEVADSWTGRENHVLLENQHANIGISEYCGLLAYWIVPQHDDGWYGEDHNGLHQHWCEQIAPKFTKTWRKLVHLATFSNGEAVYQRIETEV